MHSSLIFLVLVSIILIIFMVTCFICFIRSRQKEDQELMEQVQYSAQSQQQFQDPSLGRQQSRLTPKRQTFTQSPSDEMLINEDIRQLSHQGQRGQLISEYQARNPYITASPYHAPPAVLGSGSPRAEVRSNMTQQINSAIIGSSEAEFQNDFIQVFPMYQIAPQPEKNTTPYLT